MGEALDYHKKWLAAGASAVDAEEYILRVRPYLQQRTMAARSIMNSDNEQVRQELLRMIDEISELPPSKKVALGRKAKP